MSIRKDQARIEGNNTLETTSEDSQDSQMECKSLPLPSTERATLVTHDLASVMKLVMQGYEDDSNMDISFDKATSAPTNETGKEQ